MRFPKVRSLFRRERREIPPQSVGLFDIARALLAKDDASAERVAAVLAQRREAEEREAAERAEVDAAKRRRDATARWIENECKRTGFWFPQDWH